MIVNGVTLSNEPASAKVIEEVNFLRKLMVSCNDVTGETTRVALMHAHFEFDANVHLSGQSTFLHQCCAKGLPPDVLEQFLGRGANVNALNAIGATPLFCAALNGHAETVQWLLQHGAQPEMSTMRGDRPVDIARKSGFDEVVHLIHTHVPARHSVTIAPLG
eukprot:GEMP01040274.1.p1 GENE.GEMP01040274.1~~GEMP01040274.1.p1  ORF type:complete len:162 (+),score=41.65 GEMP01040274.1:278-763(+)